MFGVPWCSLAFEQCPGYKVHEDNLPKKIKEFFHSVSSSERRNFTFCLLALLLEVKSIPDSVVYKRKPGVSPIIKTYVWISTGKIVPKLISAWSSRRSRASQKLKNHKSISAEKVSEFLGIRTRISISSVWKCRLLSRVDIPGKVFVRVL